VTDSAGYFELEMTQYGLLRPLKTAEPPTARCAIFFSSPRCCRRDRRR
jgi:hypothetical protein